MGLGGLVLGLGAKIGPKIDQGTPGGYFVHQHVALFQLEQILNFLGWLYIGQIAKSQMGQKVKFEFNHFSVDLGDSTWQIVSTYILQHIYIIKTPFFKYYPALPFDLAYFMHDIVQYKSEKKKY